MSETTTETATKKVKETRAARLQRLLLKVLPGDATRIKSGEWGKPGPPYQFKTAADGRQKLVIEDPTTESRLGFIGATRDELLDQLEAHVKKSALAPAKA